MYEFIRGKVHTALPGMAVLDVGGVGYRVLVPISTSSRLKPGTEATLLIYHTINAEQGEERLFGFHTEEERRLFRALLDFVKAEPDPREVVLEAESLMYAAADAYIARTAEDLDVPVPQRPAEPRGKAWEEDELPALFPKLWKHFES
jgi:Holliday junction DNA helicase RuvA